MQCIAPRTVGFQHDGKTLAWSQKQYSKEYATFQVPCGKCLPCRLNYASEWAVRCVHEASCYQNNCFITLTYNEESLLSDRLQYTDFQLFVKRLRKHIFKEFLKSYGEENWKLLDKQERKSAFDSFRIGIFVTGEYGDLTKRPHWHALIFNWRPPDSTYTYSNDNGDKVYNSKLLDQLWSHGRTEFGDVTKNSANYVARYAAKKLSHGKDGEHDFEPISKKSSKQAIGKKWIEKHWEYTFQQGKIRLPDGGVVPIPRYYEKWLRAQHPETYIRYVTQLKEERIKLLVSKKQQEEKEYWTEYWSKPNRELVTRQEAEYAYLTSRINRLNDKRRL